MDWQISVMITTGAVCLGLGIADSAPTRVRTALAFQTAALFFVYAIAFTIKLYAGASP